MRRLRRFATGVALLVSAVTVMAVAAAPAQARYFRHFGFGFGYPLVYAPPPLYVPPPVYAVYAPPPVYRYGYRVYRTYRRVTYRRAVHHVVHHRWCGCSCCR